MHVLTHQKKSLMKAWGHFFAPLNLSSQALFALLKFFRIEWAHFWELVRPWSLSKDYINFCLLLDTASLLFLLDFGLRTFQLQVDDGLFCLIDSTRLWCNYCMDDTHIVHLVVSISCLRAYARTHIFCCRPFSFFICIWWPSYLP